MMKHTPGPWIFKDEDRDSGSFDIDTPQGFYIAETIPGFGPGEEKANARLIAAAPDLLEALQVMVNRFSNYSTDQEDQPKTFGCHHMAETCDMCKGLVSGWKAVQAARTAITKATGDQS